MFALPRRHLGHNLTWRIALLPLVAIMGTVAVELTLGADRVMPKVATQPINLPGPKATSTTPAAAALRPVPQFLAPAGVAVRGTTVYMSDVPTSGIWARDGKSGAETLIAGALGAGYSGDGGPAVQAQLTGPRGIAFDAAGDLFVADSGNHAIRRIAIDGTITTVAGSGNRGFSGDGGQASLARLNTPTAVAVDSAGNLYIADTLNHRIRKVTRNGVIVTVAGSGAISSVAHSTGGFGFSGDGGPAVDAQLSIPEGLAIDSQGNLYIADTGNDRVRKVDTKGIIRTIAGTGRNSYSGDGGPATRANLYAPVGIVIGPGGILYFSERDHHTIRMITSRGLIGTVAGHGGIRGDSGDGGSAAQARLNDPEGLAFGPSGELYVADTGNHRIRVIWPGTAIIATV
jgi:trimeric autotransporter adhesin